MSTGKNLSGGKSLPIYKKLFGVISEPVDNGASYSKGLGGDAYVYLRPRSIFFSFFWFPFQVIHNLVALKQLTN